MMKFRARAGLVPLTLLLIFGGIPASAQGPNRTATKFYPDFSDTADTLLRNATSHVRDGQWAEAVEIYQRVIQQYGDKVARLPKEDAAEDRTGDSLLFVDLRQFCQRRIAALPPEARAIYRNRVDAQAERWYREGAEGRDRSLLRRVVDQAFCSSWGDDALDLLGDLAFEDGRFDEALAMYRRLVPDRPDDPAGLTYPDPGVDLARVAAKKILCREASGEAVAPAALDAFAKAYPAAKGALAGRTGPYTKSLAEALKGDHLAPPAQPDGRWPTFAGSPTRNRILPGAIDVGSFQWRVDLPAFDPNRSSATMRGGFRGGFGMQSIPIPKDRLLAYHPIVIRDQVIVCNENRIQAYNLNDRPQGPPGSPSGTVKPVWEAPPENQDASTVPATMPMTAVPRYTLTAYGDKVFARLGPNTNNLVYGGRSSGQSKIVAIDRSTEGKFLWSKLSNEVILPKRAAESGMRTGFEGTPVADARHLYVAMTDRREQTSTYVVCLDAENGSTRWVRYLGAASTDNDNMMGFGIGGNLALSSLFNDFGHRLLTLDGPTLYYQTNLGAVAALDTETGGVRWVATYPRQDRMEGGPGHERDLNPAIVHDGMVIVAPSDSSSIYAFESETGRLLWKTEPIAADAKLAHLLGVAKGNLIATGDRVLLFNVKTGKLARTWPDSGRAYEGFGRGLLAGDRIYWPTKNEIHVLDQASGLIADQPIKLQETFQTTGGNLSVGDGYLIVAQPDGLVVFCQNSRLIQRYREEIARAPDQASNYYRLARAAEATDQDEEALAALITAATKARPSEMIDGVPLIEATLDEQFRLLMRLAKRERSAKATAKAIERLESAATVARSDRDRLSARMLLAEVQLERRAPADAVATLQGLLADDRLRVLSVATEDGHRSVRADLLIGDRLAEILRDEGRPLYEAFDRDAAQLLDRGKAEKDPRLLEEISRNYPVAAVVPESLLALGAVCNELNRPADSAHAYKRLLAHANNDALRARALLGLARAYEAQRHWVPARDTYVEALSRFGNVRLEDIPGDMRLSSLVSERLAHDPFDRMTGDQSEPSLPVPLARRWGRPLSGSQRPLAADGVPPSPESSRIFLVQGIDLKAVDSRSGESPWSAELGGSPVWVGYLADKIIAATDTRVVALNLEKGTIEWTYERSDPQRSTKDANPFAKADSETNHPASLDSGKLQGFQIVGDRIFCLRGERELVALDGDTGLADWSYTPATGSINPLLWIGPRRIVLQVLKPNTIHVLETSDGRRVGEYRRSEEEGWARAPLPIDDDHVALVTDRRTVALFDLKRGVDSWVFRESKELPKNGPPLLLGNAERLLVLQDGTELIRLDPATGVERWSRPLGAENLSERPQSVALDGDRFYWAGDRSLRALSLADGSITWSRHLAGPEAGWSIALTERCVLAYPVVADTGEGEAENLPLVFRRRDSGELVQRLLLPVSVSDVAIRLAPRGAMVASRGGVWALGERGIGELSKSP